MSWTPYGPYLNWPMRMGYTYICIHGLSTTTTLVDVIHPLADTLTCLLLDLVVPKGRFEECVQTNLEQASIGTLQDEFDLPLQRFNQRHDPYIIK